MNWEALLDPALSSRMSLTLVHSLWQMALLAAIVWSCERLFLWSAERRCAMYVAAMIVGLALLPVTFVTVDVGTPPIAPTVVEQAGEDVPHRVSLVPINDAIPLPADAEVAPSISGPAKPQTVGDAELSTRPPDVPPAATPSDAPQWTTLAPWVAACYAVGVVLMFLRLCFGVWSAHRLVARSRPVTDSAIVANLERLATRLSLRTRPVIAYSERVVIPKIVGLLRPAILLPSSAMTGLSPEQLEMVLAHELTHLRRHDLWVNLLQRVAEAVLFFNPCLWYLSRRINLLREYACDEAVCRLTTDQSQDVRSEYATALLRIAELSRAGAPSGRRRPAADAAELTTLAASGGSPSQLRRRIARLVGEPLREPLHLSRGSLLTLCAVTLAVILSSSLWPVVAQTDKDEAEAEQREKTTDTAEPQQDTDDDRVEVIAIGTHNEQPQRWWDASGENAQPPSVEWQPSLRRDADDRRWRRVVIHVRDLGENEEVRWELPGIAEWHGMHASRRGGSKPSRGDFAKQFVAPEEDSTFQMRVGIASGEWKTVSRLDTSDTMTLDRGEPSFISSGVFQEGEDTTVFLTHDVFEHNFRVIAVDNDGQSHDSGGRGGSSNGTFYQSRVKFRDLPLESIDHFEFQTRPYEWTEIAGLPLEPVKDGNRAGETQTSSTSDKNRPGGLTVQRNRIDSRREEIGGEDFATLVDNLGGLPMMFDPAEPVPELTFKACLASSSLRKLYELIQQLPEQERSRTAREIFEQKFDEACEYSREFQQNADEMSNNELLGAYVELGGKNDAACAGLFLVFQFCPPADLVECLEHWKQRNAQGDVRLRLEPLFALNLYVLTLVEKLNAGTIDSVLEEALVAEAEFMSTRMSERARIIDSEALEAQGLQGLYPHEMTRAELDAVSKRLEPPELPFSSEKKLTVARYNLPKMRREQVEWVSEANAAKVYEVCTAWHWHGNDEDRRVILDHLHQRLRSEIAAQNAQRPQPNADESEEDEPAEDDDNAAVDRKLEHVLREWEEKTAGITRLRGKHQRYQYDEVFATEKRAVGEFWYEAPDKGRIDLNPTPLEDAETGKTFVSKKSDASGQPYRIATDDPLTWVCDGKSIMQIEREPRTYAQMEIPPPHQEETIMDRLVPMVFGMKPLGIKADKMKQRYELSLGSQHNEIGDDGRKQYHIVARPLLPSDARHWKKAEVILDAEYCLPRAIRLDPVGSMETVYVFSLDSMKANENDWGPDPFKMKLRGYKLHSPKTLVPPPGEAKDEVVPPGDGGPVLD